MKRTLVILLVFFVFWGPFTVNAQISGHVDERFELTGIVFRLTNEASFVHANPDSYISDVESYFAKYENHELIKFIKKTLKSKSILDISLPMYFASDIEIKRNGIVWTDKWTTTFELYDTIPDDQKWTNFELDEYIHLLNKFYKETDFHKFYVDHLDFYTKVEKCFEAITDKIDTAWFSDFFGSPYKMDNIWLVPVNGDFNFAVLRTDKFGVQHNNCAISCIYTDTLGLPYIDGDRVFMVLIHEICHNYCNPICKLYENMFKDVCDTLFTFVEEMLSSNYYGSPDALIYEGFNRLCEFSYYTVKKTFNDSIINDKAQMQILDGFIWFEDMLRYMSVFFNNRIVFKTFEDFMEPLRQFMVQSVDLMQIYYLPKYYNLMPRVVATYPANNSIIDTNLTALVFQFSKPMNKWGKHTATA